MICALLLVPIVVWNALLAGRLPQVFSPGTFGKDVPPGITFGENALRALLFVLAALMPLRTSTVLQKMGLTIYIAGTVLYFVSWLPLIIVPESRWSRSFIGIAAPAITPMVWLVGIALIGDSLFIRVPYTPWVYVALSALFVGFHVAHVRRAYLNVFGTSPRKRRS